MSLLLGHKSLPVLDVTVRFTAIIKLKNIWMTLIIYKSGCEKGPTIFQHCASSPEWCWIASSIREHSHSPGASSLFLASKKTWVVSLPGLLSSLECLWAVSWAAVEIWWSFLALWNRQRGSFEKHCQEKFYHSRSCRLCGRRFIVGRRYAFSCSISLEEFLVSKEKIA